MRFLPGSLVLSLFLLFAQGIAVPVADAAPEPAPEDGELVAKRALNIPGLPGAGGSSTCNQTNQCQTGTSFCCNTENGRECHVPPTSFSNYLTSPSENTCVKSSTNCQQTVICCNNNFGVRST